MMYRFYSLEPILSYSGQSQSPFDGPDCNSCLEDLSNGHISTSWNRQKKASSTRQNEELYPEGPTCAKLVATLIGKV